MKVPFPVALIRRMDETVVAERSGFQTRAELMIEAVENLLNELEYLEAPPVTSGRADRSAAALLEDAPAGGHDRAERSAPDLTGSVPAWEIDDLALVDLRATILNAPVRPPSLLQGGVADVRDEPLLGLHNRDYVSLWALHRLARYTEDGPIGFDEYLRRVTSAAWYYGRELQALEGAEPGRKLTVLFPTNASKRPSAERGFQAFAIGGLAKQSSRDRVPATGPLFAWRAVQVTAPDDGSAVALTEDGWRLIQDLDGLSLDLPHSSDSAARFMAYLAEHAPGDRWGFDHLLALVADGPNRQELVASFAEAHPEWTDSTANSVTQGYVARAREWGLVEPRLVEGRYWLTDTGRESLARLG